MRQTHFSPLHRFLHWTIALGILLALVTAFLHFSWMNSKEMAAIISSSLTAKNIILSHGDARDIARKISSPMFQLHFYAGYVLIALLIVKCIDLFASRSTFISPFSEEATLKQKFQRWMYILFYGAVVFILVTGLLIKFGPRNDLHTVFKIVHIYCGYFSGAFMLAHFAGLLIDEHTTDKGIVSKMINGGK